MTKLDLKKGDHILIGLIPALILPVLIMSLILGYYSSFTLEYIINNPMFSPLVNDLKGALLINLGLFLLFYWLKKDKSAKGVLFATLLYAAVYIYYMFAM
ncbi:MAG: hypothetical protein QNK84_03155 [Flavobacteriales bacterium]|jgi:hypothetical protein|tara:strand:+ start:192 stop:491 length:300 start_codon:yes stop_codon:yes gene_type:complete